MNSNMEYKGYIGSVSYSDEDSVLFGKVEGINALVNYEAASVEELKKAFHEAVDDYLAFCKENDIQPDKIYSGNFNVRLTPELHKDLAYFANQTGSTINNVVKIVLERSLKREKKELTKILKTSISK
ncbi:type II toxin-antitoxin system HicB family antitoxin [Bacteroides sp. 519]|nr:type II toxin-antitoxin system HicB family antitoxin [Bacteroides sp. 519]